MTTQTRIHHMDSLARAHALSVQHYFGDYSLALERRAVFGRSWQPVAHVGQLAEAGDHVVEEVAGTPVLVLRIREWQGLVFVALNEDAPGFDEVLGGIVDRIRPIDIAAMRFTRRDVFDVACNWKVYVDNFLEGYHLPMVHPSLLKVIDYREYHVNLFDWYSLQHSPIRDATGAYGDGHAYYYFVYPNIMLNCVPGRLQTNRILPLGPDRRRVEFDFYYAGDARTQARIAKDQDFSDEVQMEDISICEAVQKGLSSGFYAAGRLSPKRESGVWHFHELLRAAYAQDEVSRPAPR